MSRRNVLLAVLALVFGSSFAIPTAAEAAQYGRQGYGSWSYHNTSNYHYRSYYYKPTPTYPSYKYHYVVYYPSQPRYYYYYNPYSKVYWGRYDLEAKGYSLLEEKDRKQKLSDIDESAFPKPGAMPGVPELEGDENLSIAVPPADAPKAE